MRSILVLLAVVLLSVNAYALSVADPKQQPEDPRVAMDKLVLPTGEFDLSWDPGFEWFAQGVEAKVTEKPDSRVTKLPEFASANPWFVVFRVDGAGDDGFVAAVIDESGGTGKGYDRAYIDCNRNRDLSDDSPCYVRCQSSHDWQYYSYYWSDLNIRNSDWVKVRSIKDRSEGRDIFVNLTPFDLELDETRSCFVSRRGGWKGMLKTNLGEVEVRLTDSNCDGIYGNASSGDGKPGDNIRISKILIPERQATDVELELYLAVRIGRRFMTISAADRKLSIQPYAGAVGTLRIVAGGVGGRGCGIEELVLSGSQTGRLNLPEIGNGQIELPAGSYKFESCSLNVSRPGTKIRVDCRFGKDYTRVVTGGKTTVLVVGGNVSTALNPEDMLMVLKAGVSNGFQRTIKLGNMLSVSSIDIGNLPAPDVQLLDFTGRVVHSASSSFT